MSTVYRIINKLELSSMTELKLQISTYLNDYHIVKQLRQHVN